MSEKFKGGTEKQTKYPDKAYNCSSLVVLSSKDTCVIFVMIHDTAL